MTAKTATRTARPSARSPARSRVRSRTGPGAWSGSSAAGNEFMKLLRDDHAGLSRVLREIDAQQTALTTSPETARAVLAEAMRYILVYQHSVHHPREDQLFSRIRDREPMLYRNMRRLVMEHRIGQEKAEALARELARASASQLRGRVGARLARQLQDYVHSTREHMRREEAVFYTGSARVLRASDWAALTAGPKPRDPAGDLHRLATRYPRLAARLGQPERAVTGAGEHDARPHAGAGIWQRVEAVTEFCGKVLHETADIARHGMSDFGKVRSPLGFVRVSVEVAARSCQYAAQLAALPFRR
jgi:hemerythrin-like domain-containing protein